MTPMFKVGDEVAVHPGYSAGVLKGEVSRVNESGSVAIHGFPVLFDTHGKAVDFERPYRSSAFIRHWAGEELSSDESRRLACSVVSNLCGDSLSTDQLQRIAAIIEEGE